MTKTERPTTAFVLAAGKGTRMRPLTNKIPKPLVPLAGKPLIDHVLDRLKAAGIENAIVNVHHHADKLEAHLKSRKAPKITISDERDALLDTGGGVMRALPRLGPKPFLIHNSDSVWIEGMGNNLERLMAQWRDDAMDALLLVAPLATSLGYDGLGDFDMDGNGVLARRASARLSPFIFTGVSIAHPRMFADAPSGAFSLNLLWDRAIEAGRLYGTRLDGVWMHVGTPEAVAEAEAAIKESDRVAATHPVRRG